MDTELRVWAASAWPAHDWVRATVVSGAFHDVLVCEPEVVARVAKGMAHQQRVAREADVARTVAELGLAFVVPQPIGDAVTHSARTGLRTTFVPGHIVSTADWPDVRGEFARVLGDLSRVTADLTAALAPPRSWCGGDGWLDVVRERLVRQLPPVARKAAERVAADVLTVEADAEPGFVHGDLGLHNMLWSGQRVHGLIDLDHACWGDPAIDIAPLIASFGAAHVAELTAPDLLDRALYHRASLPLQVASAAELVGDHRLRDHALRNFATRLTAGTLYDPERAQPSA